MLFIFMSQLINASFTSSRSWFNCSRSVVCVSDNTRRTVSNTVNGLPEIHSSRKY